MKLLEFPHFRPAQHGDKWLWRCVRCGRAQEVEPDFFGPPPVHVPDTCRACRQEVLREAWPETLRGAGVPLVYCQVPPTLSLRSDLQSWRGKPWSVLFLGPTGSGKTWAATRLYGELLCEQWSGALWMSAAGAIEKIRREMMDWPETLDRLRNVPLLLLDDLGAERDSDFTREKLSFVLCSRYDQLRPTILTSNANLLELDAWEPRVTSRLGDGRVVKLAGGDRRIKNKARDPAPESSPP